MGDDGRHDCVQPRYVGHGGSGTYATCIDWYCSTGDLQARFAEITAEPVDPPDMYISYRWSPPDADGTQRRVGRRRRRFNARDAPWSAWQASAAPCDTPAWVGPPAMYEVAMSTTASTAVISSICNLLGYDGPWKYAIPYGKSVIRTTNLTEALAMYAVGLETAFVDPTSKPVLNSSNQDISGKIEDVTRKLIDARIGRTPL